MSDNQSNKTVDENEDFSEILENVKKQSNEYRDLLKQIKDDHSNEMQKLIDRFIPDVNKK